MEADETASEGDALGEADVFDATSEAEVFNDLHAEGLEASDLHVSFAAEEVEGADADGVAFCFGVGDAPGTGSPEAEGLKEAEDGGLVPPLDNGGGNGDEV